MARSGRPGRNDPCPCGSGKKYKRCRMDHEDEPSNASEVSYSWRRTYSQCKHLNLRVRLVGGKDRGQVSGGPGEVSRCGLVVALDDEERVGRIQPGGRASALAPVPAPRAQD